MVLIPPTPPVHPPRPLFHVIHAKNYLVRLFDPSRHAQAALTFRHFGPLLRFDHHAPGAGGPSLDPHRGIYYTALNLSGCVVEVFGDTVEIECGQWHVARPRLTRPIKLLNLQGYRAMRAGSVAALAKVPDHNLAQQWSRYFYERPDYGGCDGILYENAHNDELGIALFERAEDSLECPPAAIIRLDDPMLRSVLVGIARRNNLICFP